MDERIRALTRRARKHLENRFGEGIREGSSLEMFQKQDNVP